ncbi:hypothetical protein E7T06_20850 [Deinococcus sp. Arct2-2]|nr:hypothetical protein E7T06_20850 [Deinococcus sp. Arct2-2]
MPKDETLTSHHTHPPNLATIDALKLEGLQPADGQPLFAVISSVHSTKRHFTSFDELHLAYRHKGNPAPVEPREMNCDCH